MRITDSPKPDRAENVEPAKAAAQNEQDTPPVGRLQDDVAVSPVAQALSKALEEDDSKIQNLRAQYVDGNYKVDAGKLSAKIVDDQLSD